MRESVTPYTLNELVIDFQDIGVSEVRFAPDVHPYDLVWLCLRVWHRVEDLVVGERQTVTADLETYRYGIETDLPGFEGQVVVVIEREGS